MAPRRWRPGLMTNFELGCWPARPASTRSPFGDCCADHGGQRCAQTARSSGRSAMSFNRRPSIIISSSSVVSSVPRSRAASTSFGSAN